ncbi:MAG: ABC transporter permease subunit [Candidatus Rokubacteria bacterium]|nr:ABC transporter permease subunit [Candidatus Rokubacteria bacterium]
MLLGLVSVAAMVGLYTLASSTYGRLDILPPTRAILDAFLSLVTGRTAMPGGGHVHPTDHVGGLLAQGVTLQGALAVSTLRVLFGVALGGALGILVGFWMGWSRKADDYLHPIFILVRSIPPLALITYVMLWVGHGEAHLDIPIVYAVFTTVVIPTYHGVRDVPEIHVRAARALGAGRRLLFARVVLPAAGPSVLGGLRYALVIAWMTTVGVEMLMGEDGIGHLLVGGGLWSSRLGIGVDPAVVMVAIVALATVGYAMDLATRVVSRRLLGWTKDRRPW